jgi:hypothetical protein
MVLGAAAALGVSVAVGPPREALARVSVQRHSFSIAFPTIRPDQ